MKHYLCVVIGSSCRASFFSRMNFSLILVCLFTLVIITGCAEVVVYRINPDAPPKMKLQDARDAVELSLTHRNLHPEITRVYLDGDELSAVTSRPGGRIASGTVRYDDIGWEIIKGEKDYIVPIVQLREVSYPYMRSMLSWKSEEDARLFLDAFAALRQFKIKGAKDTDVVGK